MIQFTMDSLLAIIGDDREPPTTFQDESQAMMARIVSVVWWTLPEAVQAKQFHRLLLAYLREPDITIQRRNTANLETVFTEYTMRRLMMDAAPPHIKAQWARTTKKR